MRSVAPVMNCAAGDARNTIDAATSSTVPARLSGVSAMPRSSSCGGYCAVPDEQDDAGRDRVDEDPELRPLDGERHRHVLDARARGAGVHHARESRDRCSRSR